MASNSHGDCWHSFCWMSVAMTASIVKRSKVYHLLNTIAPINHKLKAELDILGSIGMIISALAAVIVFSL